MQNNPFNFLSQWQSASGVPAANQDNTNPANASIAGNPWGNVALLGAMQNMLGRSGGGTTSVPAAAQSSLPSKASGGSNSEATSDIYRQFQLQQSQSSVTSQRAVGNPGQASVVGLGPSSDEVAAVQSTSGSWNNQGNQGAWNTTGTTAGLIQASQVTCNNSNTSVSPAAAACNAPAMINIPAPTGMSTVPNAPGMNNMLGAMFQSFMSQQMAMQTPTNPMTNMMQQMMQSMMPCSAPVMPVIGNQVMNMDNNAAKQLLVTLVGQLQQSGQLSTDDSIQKLLQPVMAISNETEVDAVDVKPEINEALIVHDVKHENTSDRPSVTSTKKAGKGVKHKPEEKDDSRLAESASDSELLDIAAKSTASVKKGGGKKKTGKIKESKTLSAESFETEKTGEKKSRTMGKDEIDNTSQKRNQRILPNKTSLSSEVEHKFSEQKPTSKGKKVMDIVLLDSDEENDGDSSYVIESTSETSSVVEDGRQKKGKNGKSSTVKNTKQTQKVQEKSRKVAQVLDYPEPLQRIKIEDCGDDDQVHGIPIHEGNSLFAEKNLLLDHKVDISCVKVEKGDDWNQFQIPANVRLQSCEVKLTRVVIKRDARGRIIVPHSETAKIVTTIKTEVPKDVETVPAYSPVRSITPYKAPSSSTGRRGGSALAQDPGLMIQSLAVDLLPNMNAACDPQLRTLYVGHTRGKMQWLSLVGWANSRHFCQCAFCPVLADSPKSILHHIRSEHPDLTFALTKMKQPSGKFLYIFCRHCDFIALDTTINWLHFEVYHNVSDILDGISRPRVDDFSPAKIEIGQTLDDIISTQAAYMCYDCTKIGEDSKQVAIHVLQEHPNTVHYNGCFVKLLNIRRPIKSENVEYRRIVSEDEFAEFRQEAFICMLCNYIAYCAYLALSHNLNTHQTKQMMFVCTENGCTFNCINESVMIQHLSGKHKLKSDLTCSSTLLEASGGRFTECLISVNRKTSQEPTLRSCGNHTTNRNNSSVNNNNNAQISPDTVTSDEGSDNDSDGGSGEMKSIKHKRIKLEGVDKNSLQCDAVSSSWEKVLEENESSEQNGSTASLEQDDKIEDKLPDDIQITINPISPDPEVQATEKSAMSDDSDGTIVEDKLVSIQGNELSPKKEGKDIPKSPRMPDEVFEMDVSMEMSVPEPVQNKMEEAGLISEVTEDDEISGDVEKEIFNETNTQSSGNGDFVTDISLEPDMYLPMATDDICKFDQDPNA